jgi:sulfate adenylyltransferase subunit 2
MTNEDNPKMMIEALEIRRVWTTQSIAELLHNEPTEAHLKATERAIQASSIRFEPLTEATLQDEHERPAKRLVLEQLLATARKKRKLILFAQLLASDGTVDFLVLNDARGGRRWIRLDLARDLIGALQDALITLAAHEAKEVVLIPSGSLVEPLRRLVKQHRGQRVVEQPEGSIHVALEVYSHGHAEILQTANQHHRPQTQTGMSHLDRLEAESIHIIREVMAEANNPVMLYSVGKDSSVMLHLARKAFYPSPPPFPLLHVDTRWKF